MPTTNTILLKRTSEVGKVPDSLEQGELAIDIAAGKLYYGDSLGSISTLTQQLHVSASGSPPVAAAQKEDMYWYQTDTTQLLLFNNGEFQVVGNGYKDFIDVDETGEVLVETPTPDGFKHKYVDTNDDAQTGAVVTTANGLQYDIDDVYITMNPANPTTKWPNTTWEPIAQGQFIASVGNEVYTDENGDKIDVIAGDAGGTYYHTLIEDEMPTHTHALGQNRPVQQLGSGAQFDVWATSTEDQTGPAGGGLKHNNTPPCFGMYMWRRLT